MSDKGHRMSGRTAIPVKEMALGMLEQMFPQLSKAQAHALRHGLPVPSSERERFDSLLFSRVVGRMEAQLVTAIMPFYRTNQAMLKLARKAVAQFMAQSWPNKQLVIVNATPTPVTNVPHRLVKEVSAASRIITSEPTVAELRNIGLAYAEGEWVKPCWDDDDWYDPHLLTYLMLHRRPGRAVMLSSQIRASIWDGTVYVNRQPDGVPDTALVPRSAEARFSDVENDDLAFVNEHYGVSRVVIDNASFPENSLSIRVWHGHNLSTRESFMGPYASAESAGAWGVDEAEAEHLKAALATFGLEAARRAGKEAAAT